MTIENIIEEGIAEIVFEVELRVEHEQCMEHALQAEADEEYEGPWDACITALEEQGGFL